MDTYKTWVAGAIASALLIGAPMAAAQDAPVSGQDQEQIRALVGQLQTLKSSYAQEVRRLRELDMQVQALQARLAGKAVPNAALPALPTPDGALAPGGSTAGNEATQAGTMADAEKAKEQAPTRSMQDALLQEHALFDRKLTIENSLSYSHYDRKQLTLNGFLALDAIFLGNIAIENVKSDSLTYNLATRYGISPRLTLNLDVPYLARQTAYVKGGAGGSAAAIAEEQTRGNGIGDISFSANYKLFAETQVGWMDEQLHFTWKDKWPLSARLFLATVALATLIGLTYWGYSAHFCV